MFRRAVGLAPAAPAPARPRVAWLTSLAGLQGPQSVSLAVYRIGEALPPGPGVFLFAAHTARRWTCLFVGETEDLRSRVSAHEALPEAILMGATHVHTLRVGDFQARQYAAERLVFMYGPPLNASDSPTLDELIHQGAPLVPEPLQPRLAIAGGH